MPFLVFENVLYRIKFQAIVSGVLGFKGASDWVVTAKTGAVQEAGDDDEEDDGDEESALVGGLADVPEGVEGEDGAAGEARDESASPSSAKSVDAFAVYPGEDQRPAGPVRPAAAHRGADRAHGPGAERGGGHRGRIAQHEHEPPDEAAGVGAVEPQQAGAAEPDREQEESGGDPPEGRRGIVADAPGPRGCAETAGADALAAAVDAAGAAAGDVGELQKVLGGEEDALAGAGAGRLYPGRSSVWRRCGRHEVHTFPGAAGIGVSSGGLGPTRVLTSAPQYRPKPNSELVRVLC